MLTTFFENRYPDVECRPSAALTAVNILAADRKYQACLRAARKQRLEGDKCRNNSILSSSELSYQEQLFLIWEQFVIPESIAFCRQWASQQVYVTFATTSPMGMPIRNNVGREINPVPPNWGLSPSQKAYRGPAWPAQSAVSLGLVSQDQLNTFLSGQGSETRGQLTPEVVQREQADLRKHNKLVGRMAQLDSARTSIETLWQDIGENFSAVMGKITSGITSIFGSAIGGFFSGLGPLWSMIILASLGFIAYRLVGGRLQIAKLF